MVSLCCPGASSDLGVTGKTNYSVCNRDISVNFIGLNKYFTIKVNADIFEDIHTCRGKSKLIKYKMIKIDKKISRFV